jgi:hypothetical protein
MATKKNNQKRKEKGEQTHTSMHEKEGEKLDIPTHRSYKHQNM